MSRLKLLFLCTGNSCRSQMAEGFLRAEQGQHYEAVSAGSRPSGRVDPRAIAVMAELGIDISAQRSKSADEFAGQSFDAVVTVCDTAREACPYFSGAGQKLHQSFDDPPELAQTAGDEEEALLHYRRVRDEIRQYVATLPMLLTAGSTAPAD